MTRLLFFVLSIGAAISMLAIPPATTTSAQSPGANAVSPRAHERTPSPSLWGDSKKLIEQGGSDVGGWIAERRALLVEASVRNPYFWFCVVSLVLIAVLTSTLYFVKVSEHRKIWKATAAMTDLWNWALYADAQARQAIRRYNKHIERCNRLADLELSGKAPVPSAPAEESHRLRGEVDSLRREKVGLEQQLAAKEAAIQSLTARVDEIARKMGAGGSVPVSHSEAPTSSRLQAQLMEKVNILSSRNQQLEQELKDARQKFARLGEEKAPAC